MKKLKIIGLLSLITVLFSLKAFALPSCLTNVNIYCVGNAQTSTSNNGSSSSPTNELHGMDLLNSSGDQNGMYVNFYGTCSGSDQVIAVIVYECNDNWCLGGRCAAGAHQLNVTLPAGCDYVSGYIGMMYGNCCAITWNPLSCHPCAVPPGPAPSQTNNPPSTAE